MTYQYTFNRACMLVMSSLIASSVFGFTPLTTKKTLRFGGAAILPIVSLPTKKGKPKDHYIISRNAFGQYKGTFDDFGGSRDPQETHPVQTAAREFYEEALAGPVLKKSIKNLEKKIDLAGKDTQAVLVQSIPGKGGKSNYVTFIARFGQNSSRKMTHAFGAARAKPGLAFAFKEKDQIALVRVDKLKQALLNNPNNNNVFVPAKVYAGIKPVGKISTIKLHPFFAKRIRAKYQGKPIAIGTDNRVKLYA